MINDLRITVLVDNTVARSDLLAEHGLSFWIEADQQHMLFDVGQGKVLSHNLESLGIDLAIAEAIVISHGHYDHTGCLDTVLEKMSSPTLYLHPEAVKKKYARCSSPPHREIGMPESSRKAVIALGQNVIWTRHVTEIFPFVHVTGQIPRRNDHSDTGGPFFLDPKCCEPDPLLDDQALFFETAEGVVAVLGCAHAGVASTLDYIFELTNRRQILAVIGGTHLSGAGKSRLQETLDAFERYQVPEIAPAHCTGIDGMAALWNSLPGRCLPCAAGTAFQFGGDSE